MKKPIFLILVGIGVLLLVGGVVFVVPWFGKMFNEMEEMAEKHAQHRRALRETAREPLTEEQVELLSQLLEVAEDPSVGQTQSSLESILSSDPYLAYLKTQEGADYADFLAYVNAMPTENMKAAALTRLTATLGVDMTEEELKIWENYYFVVREWGTTVEDPRDNMKELNELQQTHLIEPLMGSDAEVSGWHTKIVQIGMSSIFMTEDSKVFQKAWRNRLETYGEQEGLLRCAIASPGEFALMRSFFEDMAAFQEWIVTRPEPEVQTPEQ